ncbi:MAG: O-antigen ligase family protein, partial [Chloroflexi bacterium]|nr:O-antigen ligase family protein [Chloroflexota bacterium]
AGVYFAIIAVAWISLLVGCEPDQLPAPRGLLLAMVGLVMAALMLTISREAFAGFGCALLYQLVRWRRRELFRRAAIGFVAVAAVVGVLVLVSPSVLARVQTTNSDDFDVYNRFAVWGETMHMFQLSPIVGIGFSRWNDVDTAPSDDAGYDGVKGVVWLARNFDVVNNDDGPHNSYLAVGSELGLVGLTLLLSFWGGLLWSLKSSATDTSLDSFTRSLSSAGEAVVVLALVDALFGLGLGAPAGGLPLALWAGLAVSLSRRQRLAVAKETAPARNRPLLGWRPAVAGS